MESSDTTQRLSPSSAARVFLFGALMFFLELLLFRVLNYVTHYLQSMLIIAYALTGVALGGLIAARVKMEERTCFCACLVGTYGCLFLSLAKILQYPSLGLDNLTLVGLFTFPALYISSAFQRYSAGRVYQLDLGGAGLAVVLLFVAQRMSYLEMNLLATSLLMATVGLASSVTLRRGRAAWGMLFLTLTCLSAGAMVYEIKTGKLNLYYLATPDEELSNCKIFGQGYERVRFYDNLVSRIEIVKSLIPTAPRYHYVSAGIIQDGFRPDYPLRYRRDPRLVGNLVDEPHIFIVGSSAQGILKTARYLTRPENIEGMEVNPAVYDLMISDFFKDSGYACAGLNIKLGNALAVLARTAKRYDIITLMNTHSMGQMFLSGPPDWLHTVESYQLYLSRLTPDGYIMVEERPMEPPGREIFFRRVATIYEALRRSGVADPAQHLFIYSWVWNRSLPYEEYRPMLFTSMVVKKSPITRRDADLLMDWVRITGYRWEAEGKRYLEASPAERQASGVRLHYLPGIVQEPAYADLFAQLAQGTLAKNNPKWDYTPVSDDRPFSSLVDKEYPTVKKILFSVGWLAGILVLPVLLSFRTSPNRGFHARMHLYQFLAGAGYILMEVYLMQLYQKHILSAILAFVLVLAVLLLCSGLGGHILSNSRGRHWVWLALVISVVVHYQLAANLVSLGWPEGWKVAAILLVTAWSGFFMGAFLPMGLNRARLQGHGSFIADYFATNSLGGTLALALSLYLSIVYGFTATAGLAIGCYLLVALL